MKLLPKRVKGKERPSNCLLASVMFLHNNNSNNNQLSLFFSSQQSVQNFGNSYITNPSECNDLAVPVANPCLNASTQVNLDAESFCSLLQNTSGKLKKFSIVHYQS